MGRGSGVDGFFRLWVSHGAVLSPSSLWGDLRGPLPKGVEPKYFFVCRPLGCGPWGGVFLRLGNSGGGFPIVVLLVEGTEQGNRVGSRTRSPTVRPYSGSHARRSSPSVSDRQEVGDRFRIGSRGRPTGDERGVVVLPRKDHDVHLQGPVLNPLWGRVIPGSDTWTDPGAYP